MKKIKASTVLAVVIAAVVAGIVFIVQSTSTDDAQIIIDESTEGASSEAGSESCAETEETETESYGSSAGICVYVCGAVNEPGVYYLDEDARVYQAVEMAGGALEDAAVEYINMAGTLTDGQQVYIPSAGDVSEGTVSLPAADTSDTAGSDGKININTATAEELCTLTGIGQVRAEAIIAYREANGNFETIEDICNVSGIKDATFEKIKDQIKV